MWDFKSHSIEEGIGRGYKMKIGICDDDPAEIVRIRSIIKEKKNKGEVFELEDYKPENLQADVAEGYFDCQILVMDVYFEHGSREADYDGIDLAKQVNEKYPLCKIIFVSSFSEYTEYVYDTDHVFFIQKKNMEHFIGNALQKAVKAYHEDEKERIIEFFNKGQKTWVRLRDILFVEKDDRNIRIHTANESYSSIKSLKQFQDDVKGEPITRCNSATLVNIRYVKTLSTRALTLENGQEFDISDTYAEQVKKTFLNWWKGRM